FPPSFHILYFFFLLLPPPPTSPLFPYTTLFRSSVQSRTAALSHTIDGSTRGAIGRSARAGSPGAPASRGLPSSTHSEAGAPGERSEEHTSELQSRENLVCRLLLEKKKKKICQKI